MGFEDPNYVPPIKLSTDLSNFSDYFSEEEYKSSDSIIFTCQIHQLQYDNIDEFVEHQVNEHTVNGRFACGLCEKTYSNKYLRRGHVAGYHLGETYSCSILNCGRKFSWKKYRNQHERMHKVPASENVHYVCDICNSLFDNVDSLKQHKLQHSSSKKFICRYCKFMGTQDLMTETITKRSVILNLQLKPKKVLLTVQVVKVVKENNQLRETFSNLRRVVKEMLHNLMKFLFQKVHREK